MDKSTINIQGKEYTKKKRKKEKEERENVTMALKCKETYCPAAVHDKIIDLIEGTVWHVLSPVGRLKCD